MSGTHKGWLIYDEAGIKRNKWFAEHLLECAPEYGLELELKILPTEGGEFWELPREKQDSIREVLLMEAHEKDTFVSEIFVIMRVIAPHISRALEQLRIRVFNNGITARVANDKWLTYQKALEWGLPVLDTCLVKERTMADGSVERDVPGVPRVVSRMQYPQVLKAVSGHGGSQVFWADNEQQRMQIIRELTEQGITPEEIICQQSCSEPGKDMRVYVLGGAIYCAVLRSAKGDFRSNFSLGGQIALAELTREQRKVVDRLYEELQFDFVGIDFIAHEGGWILNEIEDVVGTRMIYQLTDKDPVRDYLAYISDTETER